MELRPLPDWNALSFRLFQTDLIYRAFGDRHLDPVWQPGRFVPFADISLSPAAAFMSYGQGVFEGLKARRTTDGRILVFRPDANARRFGRSAARVGMAPFPEDEFLRAVVELVRQNVRFVPPTGRGAFYIRPVQVALEPRLGLSLCDQFGVIAYGSPVGSYFAKGDLPGLRIRVLEQGRVAPGGTGAAKAMGNYAGTIPLAQPWKERGFDDVLFLDAREERLVTESVGSNVFVVLRSGTLVTPPLDDQILPGVTRDSVIRIARESKGMTVEERALPIDEVMSDATELFFTGTAYTLLSINELSHRDETARFPTSSVRDSLFETLDGIQTGRDADPYGWNTEI